MVPLGSILIQVTLPDVVLIGGIFELLELDFYFELIIDLVSCL